MTDTTPGPELDQGVAVTGTPTTQQGVIPSDAAMAADRSNRKARTAAQAFPAAALVALVVYLLLLGHVDLNPDPKLTDPPTEQVLGAGALVTWGIASWMNREPRGRG
jgi:hypothetical protein